MKNKRKKSGRDWVFISSFLCFAFLCTAANGQISNLNQGFQSPEAASLGKFGDMPVSYYTGTPAINIPLYVVRSGDLEIPITLDYHASGIKVDEIASWVGLGWALNAGGVITRTVRGLPDEVTNGYLNNPFDYLYNDNYWPLAGGSERSSFSCFDGDLPCLVQQGEIDTEPDIYFYNMNGRSGKFLNGPNGAATIPFEHLSITGNYVDWTIIDEKGIRYLFGSYGTTPPSEIESIYEQTWTDDGMHVVESPGRYFKSGWYLREIQSPSGDQVIRFNYDLTQTQSEQKNKIAEKELMEICYVPNVGNLERGTQTTEQKITIDKPLLTSIETNSETITFIRSENRSDQPFGTTGLTKLEEIQARTKQGRLKKRIKMGYDYFNSSSDQARRLRLESITEYSPDLSEKGQRYSFSYIGDQAGEPSLPDYGSDAKDFWGYYNGATGNSTALPEIPELNISGANRKPDSVAMLAGLLNGIIYPTGGTTNLEYEPHDYSRVGRNWLSIEEVQEVDINKSAAASYNSLVDQQYEEGTWVRYDDWVTQQFSVGNITEAPANVTITWPFMRNDRDANVVALGELVEILDSNGNILGSYHPANDDDQTTTARLYGLSAGTYTIRMKGIDVCSSCSIENGTINWTDDLPYLVYEATISWVQKEVDVTNLSPKRLAGGVRIKTIRTDPVNGPEQVREFIYSLSSDSTRSSGVIVNEPEHYYSILIGSCWARQRASASLVPLGSLSGLHVGYSEVKVTSVENGGGGTKVFHYTNAGDAPDINYHDYTSYSDYYGDVLSRAQTSNEWRRGHLYKTEYYRNDGTLLQETSTEYEPHLEGLSLTNGQFNINNFDIDESSLHPLVSVLRGSAFAFPADFTISLPQSQSIHYVSYSVQSPYYLVSGRFHPIKTTVKTYDAAGTSVITTTQYIYEESGSSVTIGQLREQTETNSSGQKRITEYTYAHEVTDDGAGLNYAPMGTLNMLTQPYSVTVKDGAGTVLRKRWTRWSDETGWWRPSGEWEWAGGNPEAVKFQK